MKGRAAPAPRDDDDGDGGNVEDGYPVEGGYLRDEAVSLLRRFYVQENGRGKYSCPLIPTRNLADIRPGSPATAQEGR